MADDLGILIMFAVRRALSQPERLQAAVEDLIARGEVDADIDPAHALDFVLGAGGAVSIADAAYRFCREEPGVHVVLSGTGNPAHLQANLESFERPPLSAETIQRLKDLFRHAHSVTGE